MNPLSLQSSGNRMLKKSPLRISKRPCRKLSHVSKGKITSYVIKKKRIDFFLNYPQYDEVFAILRSKISQIERELSLRGVQIKPLLDYITCVIRIWGFRENSTDQFIKTTLFDTCKVPTDKLINLEKRITAGKMFVILRYPTIPDFFYGLLLREIKKNRNLIEKKLNEKIKTFSLQCYLGKIMSYEFKWDFPTPWKPFQTPCPLCSILLKKNGQPQLPLFHPEKICPLLKRIKTKEKHANEEEPQEMEIDPKDKRKLEGKGDQQVKKRQKIDPSG